MTSGEEKLYLQRYREGDLAAKNILIEHNLRLVAHIVKKYQGSGEDPEDLISIGTIGLIKAISTFDAEKSTRLSTYAARCKNAPVKSPCMIQSEQTGKEMRSAFWISLKALL